MKHVNRIAALLLFAAWMHPAAAQHPRAQDVESPEAVVAAAYASIQRAPGAQFQWDRFRSLFLPHASLIPNTEQTGGAFRVMSPQQFVEWIDANTAIGGQADKGFAEEPIHQIVHRYGDTAHVYSTYQKHFWNDEHILGRGINSFQLVHTDGRWWIASIVWDEESGAGAIPPRYLPE